MWQTLLLGGVEIGFLGSNTAAWNLRKNTDFRYVFTDLYLDFLKTCILAMRPQINTSWAGKRHGVDMSPMGGQLNLDPNPISGVKHIQVISILLRANRTIDISPNLNLNSKIHKWNPRALVTQTHSTLYSVLAITSKPIVGFLQHL